jgi:transcriptional regulator with XRE-family HTH domain
LSTFVLMSIGNNVKKIRELKNLKQEYLAKQIGVSRRYYMMMENEEVEIKKERLELISKVLDVNVSELNSFDNKKIFSHYLSDTSLNQANILILEAANLKKEKEFFEKQKELYEKLLIEKDFRIKTLEDSIEALKTKKK